MKLAGASWGADWGADAKTYGPLCYSVAQYCSRSVTLATRMSRRTAELRHASYVQNPSFNP